MKVCTYVHCNDGYVWVCKLVYQHLYTNYSVTLSFTAPGGVSDDQTFPEELDSQTCQLSPTHPLTHSPNHSLSPTHS